MRLFLKAILSLTALSVCSGVDVSPYQWLTNQTAPNFKTNYTLPHLSRWTSPNPATNVVAEMADKWGYCLTFGELYLGAVANLSNPAYPAYYYASLVNADPNKYKAQVNISRYAPTVPDPITSDFYCTNAAGLFVDALGNSWADYDDTNYTKVPSPEGNTNWWHTLATNQSWVLRNFETNIPITVVMHGGEYTFAVDIPINKKAAWVQDPRVIAGTNGLSWWEYSSKRKAAYEGYTYSEVKQYCTNRDTYVYYQTSYSTQHRTNDPWKNVYEGYWGTGWMTNMSDLPNAMMYYGEGNDNSGFVLSSISKTDMLTQYLNTMGYFRQFGIKHSYDWVCAGYSASAGYGYGDLTNYIGFLKCLYTAGMIGAADGYFSTPAGGWDATFNPASPPRWLEQEVALSHVHALFTHLEPFVYSGDLLAGPTNHIMSTDQPGYEFPTGDYTARVLARKMNHSDQWLVTAWACTNADRTVTVTIPTLGTISPVASATGSVYYANSTNLILLDEYGSFPDMSERWTKTIGTATLGKSSL